MPLQHFVTEAPGPDFNTCFCLVKPMSIEVQVRFNEGFDSSQINIYNDFYVAKQLPTLHCTVIGLTRERFVALGLPS